MRKKSKPYDSPDDLAHKLGAIIATGRKTLGMTQEEFAGVIGVEPVTISRFERGLTIPSLQRLLVIAKALGVSIGELFAEASPLTTDRARKVAAAMETLDERDQRLLLDFALLLAKR